jgi:uncharacterized protein YndB with AHSA1/START domain
VRRIPLIEAVRVVPVEVAVAYAFLARLDNHFALADRAIEVVALERDGTGGRVRMRGPLGFRRTARTCVESVHPPRLLVGTARVGRLTRARVSWRLEPEAGGAARVRVAAAVEAASALDRALLALGGRAWLRRRFAEILARLEEELLRAYRPPRAAALSGPRRSRRRARSGGPAPPIR